MIGHTTDRMFKPVARALESGHMRRAGIGNTMRIAGTYARLRYGKALKYRQQQYRDHFDDLLAENGAMQGPVSRIDDGWALDTSHKLPHLDQMLTDAQEIIKERGGTMWEKGFDRPFFQQLLTTEHLSRYPSLLNFGLSSEVLFTISRYLGFIPVLSGGKPLGVRLNESDEKFNDDPTGPFRSSQLFHCDYHDTPMVYVIVTLRDVAMENGPFCFLPASVSAKADAKLKHWKRGRSHRVKDEQMYAVADQASLKKFCHPAGTVLFLDNSVCFHYGSRHAVKPRYMMMYAYLSAARTDFSDLLYKQTKYPVKDGDSRLRKMVLDRDYVG